ncbi:hypothetical protein [Flagellimonas allohymeniacidonis]|uniref:Uncharacterized protein n=1 Tax=Flagellimonas allohymeniacidonis TaxID=2517819 RepID=A0A4Q8QLJ9_9FLAO|nr:hypothetical protein [Allomuricauda hymeniacidonis]TAI49723.1 hypothetical protein EW142_07980 [Allomuricauda hymeniacidonis]
MKKYIIVSILSIMPMACGIIEDTSEETVTYTYILKNETGIALQIISDFGRIELISNGNSFQCETIANPGYVGGLCSGELEIRIPDSNKGYRCFGLGSESIGLCFVEDRGLFTISNYTVFKEIDTRTYEYILTPELIENAFELPD